MGSSLVQGLSFLDLALEKSGLLSKLKPQNKDRVEELLSTKGTISKCSEVSTTHGAGVLPHVTNGGSVTHV